MLRRPKVPGALKKLFLPIDQYVDFHGVIFFRAATTNCGHFGLSWTAYAPKIIQLCPLHHATARSRSRFAAMAHAAKATPMAVSQTSGVIINMAPTASRIRVHQASAHFA
jgi:hypothetical protein